MAATTGSCSPGNISISGAPLTLTFMEFDINGNALTPNSNGWMAEIAYMPFGASKAPGWPWLNARIGLQYIYYNKFDGTTIAAQDNNTLFLHSLGRHVDTRPRVRRIVR